MQATLDGITAAFYNAFFTSLPIGAFALFDRPLRRLRTYEAYPEAYNRKPPLTAAAFWKTGVALAVVHALVRAREGTPHFRYIWDEQKAVPLLLCMRRCAPAYAAAPSGTPGVAAFFTGRGWSYWTLLSRWNLLCIL